MQFPRYDSKRSLTTDRPEPLRDEAAAQGKLVRQAVDVAADIAVKMDSAILTSQINAGKLNKDVAIADINDRFSRDPNPDFDKYSAEIDKVGQSVTEGMSGRAKKMFAMELSSSLEMAKIKLRGEAYKKLATDSKNNVVKSGQYDVENYVNAVSEGERQVIRANRFNQIDKNVENGILFPETGEMLKKTFEEDVKKEIAKKTEDSIIGTAINDPVAANEMLESTDVFTNRQKVELRGKIKSAYESQQKETELIGLKIQMGNQKKVSDVLLDPELGYMAKKQQIQILSENDGVDKKTKDMAELVLNSSFAKEAKTYDDTFADMVRMIDSLEGAVSKGVKPIDAKEYMRRVQETKNAVMGMHANGRLTIPDVKKLLDKVDKDTMAEQRNATKSIRGEGGLFWRYTYGDANKDFESNLGNKAYIDGAMRDYFYEVESLSQNGGQPSTADKKAIMQTIVKKYNDNVLSGVSTEPVEASNVPKVGTVKGGYEFLGGDPAKQTNWKKVS